MDSSIATTTYMCQTPVTYTCGYCSTHTITHYQGTSARQRLSTRSADTICGQVFWSSSKTTASHALPAPAQSPVTQDIWPSKAASSPGEALELHLYGFH